MGGNGPRTFDRIMEYGDGWLPLAGRPGGKLDARIAELQRLAAERGRPPVPVSLFQGPGKPEVIEHYIEVGAERYIFWLPPEPADVVLPKLDNFAELMAKFI
jgi:hypothetical protein